MKIMKSNRGFTLIEIMLVVIIIGILAGVLAPKLGHALRKAHESTSRGNLGMLRGTVSIYFSNNEGRYPTDNLTSLVPNYTDAIPNAQLSTTGLHQNSSAVLAEAVVTDNGGWSYNNIMGTPGYGTVHAGCTHNDMVGNVWSSF